MNWKNTLKNTVAKPKQTDIFAYLNRTNGFAVTPMEFKRMKHVGDPRIIGLETVLIKDLTTDLLKEVQSLIYKSMSRKD